jgi:hypothetical protein
MNRPTAREINYFDFKEALGRATVSGARIEPPDRSRWDRYIAAHGIREAMFLNYCKGMCESLKPVVIDDEGPWAGYYLYSSDEEVCFKWARKGADT